MQRPQEGDRRGREIGSILESVGSTACRSPQKIKKKKKKLKKKKKGGPP